MPLPRHERPAVVNRPSPPGHRAAQFDLLEVVTHDEFRAGRAGSQFGRREVEIVPLLNGMVRPFVPHREPRTSRLALRVDPIAANDLRLFPAIFGERGNGQRTVRPAHGVAVPFIKPLRWRTPRSRGGRPPAQPHSNIRCESVTGRDLRCTTRHRVHRVTRFDASQVRQPRPETITRDGST